MAPKRTQAVASRGGSRPGQQPTFLQSAYREVTAAENQSVIRSMAIFGVSATEFSQRSFGRRARGCLCLGNGENCGLLKAGAKLRLGCRCFLRK